MSEPTTKELMARMFEIRAAKAALNEKIKALDTEWKTLEHEVLSQMAKQGSSKVSVDGLGTAILSKTLLPTVQDWDALYEHIKATDAFHLLQRRVSTPAFRELIEAGEVIPGVQAFEDVSINLRAK